MPRVLPLADVAGGLLNSVGTAVKYWLHYTLVALAWLGIVPLTAYRMYRFLFSGSFESLMSLPFEIFSIWTLDNIAADVFRGCFVVTCTLFGFIGLVWLREQIVHGGGPDWLDEEPEVVPEPADPAAARPPEVPPNVVEEDDEIENNNNINNNNNNNEINVANWVDDREPHDEAPIDRPIDPAEPPAADANEQEGEPEPPEEANWNPMEWDRAAEELTWERLLGLDGSMVFLEHVFWVVSLNTICIFIFAFCPFSIGNFVISFTGLIRQGKPLMHFHGLVTTLIGYCIIGITLLQLHSIAKFFRLRKPRRILGLCYIVVKVSLLSVVEIGVLPLVRIVYSLMQLVMKITSNEFLTTGMWMVVRHLLIACVRCYIEGSKDEL